jgi:hypothetical protein
MSLPTDPSADSAGSIASAAPVGPGLIFDVALRNIVPVCGMIFLGWPPGNLILLYFADTMLSLCMMLAALMFYFIPVSNADGLGERLNGLAGPFAGAALATLILAIPLGVPVIFMLADTGFSLLTTLTDPGFQAGLAAQFLASLMTFRTLYGLLRTHTPEQIELKKRFGLIFVRWFGLIMITFTGLPQMFGSVGPYLLVIVYAGLTIWSELLPDRFLKAMPGGADIEKPDRNQSRDWARIAKRLKLTR